MNKQANQKRGFQSQQILRCKTTKPTGSSFPAPAFAIDDDDDHAEHHRRSSSPVVCCPRLCTSVCMLVVIQLCSVVPSFEWCGCGRSSKYILISLYLFIHTYTYTYTYTYRILRIGKFRPPPLMAEQQHSFTRTPPRDSNHPGVRVEVPSRSRNSCECTLFSGHYLI